MTEVTTHRAPRDDSLAGATASISSGSLAWLVAQIVGNAGLFAGVLLIARDLGPEGRGVVAFLTVSAQVMGYVASCGVSEATIVFAAQRPIARQKLLANALLAAFTGGVAGALIVSGALLLAPAIRPDGIGTPELLVLGLAIATAAMVQGGQSLMTGCSLFRQQALIVAAAPWLYPLAMLLVWAVSDLTVARAALAWAAAIGASSLANFAVLVSRFGLTRPDFDLLWESIRFGIRAWVGNLARFLNFRVDQILIAFIAAQATLGHYSVAVNTSEVLLYVPTAVGLVLAPLVAPGGDDDRAERTLRVFRGVCLLTCASVLVAAIVGPVLIPLLFGSEFQSSVSPFLILLPGSFGFAAVAIFQSALMASGSPGLSSLGWLVALPLGVALDLALIPVLGANGAALAASIALTAGGLTALIAFRARSRFAWSAVFPGRRDASSVIFIAGHLLARVRTGS